MTFLFQYDPVLRRLWLFKRRCHHGLVGCLAVGVGIVLAWHDRKDRGEWFALKRYEAGS